MEKILEKVKLLLDDNNIYECLECETKFVADSWYVEINPEGKVYKTCPECGSADLKIINDTHISLE